MSGPLGFEESLERVDEGLAASEADIRSLSDLIHDDGPVSPGVISFLERKRALLGHMRRDFREDLAERVEGSA